jgi:beta-lactamase class A
MKRFFQATRFHFIIFPIVIFSARLAAQPDTAMQKLKQKVANELSAQKGVFAVAFRDISTGKQLLINEKEVFHAASTMKTPVMIEVYRQASKKKFSLNDSLVVVNEFRSIVDSSVYSLDSTDDSEFELYKHIGEKRSIHDLVYQMIIASSNLATNLIIQKVDAKNVTKTMRRYGAMDIQVLRGVEDQKAFDKGLNNTTTAYDLMLIFEKIAKGKAVNKKASQAMINILLDQKFNTIIPAQLPKDVKVAHKTGFITGIHHDSGIVILPDGRKYVLVLMSKNIEDETSAIKAMAETSRMIYEFVASSNRK